MIRGPVTGRISRLALLLAALLCTGPLVATTWVVDTALDENDGGGCVATDCSLREALAVAVDTDTISIELTDPDNVINLTLGQLVVAEDVAIVAPGPVTVDANSNSRIFSIANGATVSIAGLTLREGRATSGSRDGGCITVAGALTLDAVDFESCRGYSASLGQNVAGGDGGAIFVASNGSLVASTVFFDQCKGGNGGGAPSGLRGGRGGAIAIADMGTARLDVARFTANLGGDGGNGGPNGPGGDGGAIAVLSGGSLRLDHAVLAGNHSGDGAAFGSPHGSDGRGGAVYCAGDCALSNVTLSGNAIGSNETNGTSARGGGLYTGGGITRLRNLTIAANIASGSGGGIAREGGQVLVRHSLLAGNDSTLSTNDNCYTTAAMSLVSEGHNLLATAEGCSSSLIGSDLFGTAGAPLDPLIGPLASGGFLLETHPLLEDSPAIDTGDAGGCEGWDGAQEVPLTDDQRGEPRPTDGDGDAEAVCDIGAYEAEGVPPVTHELEVVVVGPPGAGTVTSDPVGISCPGDCTEDYVFTTTVDLTANPAEGFAFVAWSDGCAGNGACAVGMEADRLVTAQFAATFELSVVLDGGGSGVVESTPAGILCPGTCNAAFLDGTEVTLAATPAGDSLFEGWGSDCSGSGACVLTLDLDHAVSATFELLSIFADGFESGDTTAWSLAVPFAP